MEHETSICPNYDTITNYNAEQYKIYETKTIPALKSIIVKLYEKEELTDDERQILLYVVAEHDYEKLKQGCENDR